MLPGRYSRRWARLSALLLLLWAAGVGGYMWIEGWSFRDALYMTTISLTTVGYEEVHPLSPEGRSFTVGLLLVGVGFFFYALGLLSQAVLEGHLRGFWERRRMEKAIDKLNHHFIICGYGRIGRTIQRTISERGIPVVVVENQREVVEELSAAGLLYVEGDATQDEVLLTAGVERARGVICVLHSDADNVYVTLTARAINPGLMIVARADDANAEKKMIQAGADRVISPYEIGARRMALAVLQPTVTEFLDLAVHSTALDLKIEQVELAEDSPLVGRSLAEAAIREETGVTVLAVQQLENHMFLGPPPSYVLRGGDILVVMGDGRGLAAFRDLASAGTREA